MERRTLLSGTQFRAAEDAGELYIEGYFAVFGQQYELWSGIFEDIDRHAFDDQLNGDVRALINHDTTLVLGRTAAGTLTLSVDDTGLYGRIRVNREDSDAMNAYARVKRGDVSQCSFGFDIISERSRVDGETYYYTILSLTLYEVSVCTFPAYTDTSVEARDGDSLGRRKHEIWKIKTKEKMRSWL